MRPLDALLADVGLERPGVARSIDCRCASGPGWWDAANIALDESQLEDARSVADAVSARYRARKVAETRFDIGEWVNLEGMAAELAASLATGLEWSRGQAKGGRADLTGWGDGVEVRSNGWNPPMLAVYTDANQRNPDRGHDHRPFILARVNLPVVRLVGWAWGRDVLARGTVVDGTRLDARWLRVEQLHRLPLHGAKPREHDPIGPDEFPPSVYDA